MVIFNHFYMSSLMLILPPMLMGGGVNLDLHGSTNATVHYNDSRKYGFDVNISYFLLYLHCTSSPTLIRLNLNLDGMKDVAIHLSDPENCKFNISIASFWLLLHVIPLTPILMGAELRLKQHSNVTIHPSNPRNYGFHTVEKFLWGLLSSYFLITFS